MEPDIAYIASLIGDNARSKMLMALMGGKALTATELALEADVTSQTASSHLMKLVEGRLLVVRKQGRHKYFQLKDQRIAELLEQLLNITAALGQAISTGPNDERLRRSRVCYDHLAGELGVQLFDNLVEQGWVIENADEATLTDNGHAYFQKLGFDHTKFKSRRPTCKACLDWSERRSHMAGKLGQWILDDALSKEWAIRDLDSRAIQFTPRGLSQFCKKYKMSI
ncbi:ArsR/SmtB family transcription factor [Vibrio nigripulchritudo]|uniref:ArsR/SmtB family transcription factor n=1 Tax=Vibrio nigripulchritudo TaxID=28173 RepID=UPI002492A4FF|nr:winged helix-turn-helix domain-containing protein [Vibrio nigripulchritudo]BDU39556.1 transcriptional regulator [Vibrio nigripulchritudo]BDU45277.1 transcriptional regulator [Vibrio nigripulchritudo]